MKKPWYFTFLLFPTVLCAQYPLSITPVLHNFSVDQGLPNNWIYDIVQDKKGFIWIATNSGVCRFNGYEFEQFSDTLNCNYTPVLGRCMAEDDIGRMWFVDFRHRLFYVENNRIIPSKYNQRLEGLRPETHYYQGLIIKGRGEEIWMGGLGKALLHLVEQKDTIYSNRPDHALINIIENNYGWSHFVGVDQIIKDVYNRKIDLISFNGHPLNVAQLPINTGNFSLFSVNRLDNGFYILTVGTDLYGIKNGKLVWNKLNAFKKAVIWVTMDAEGRVFTGHHYGGGLAIYHSLDDLRAGRSSLSLLPGLTVSCIMQDREGGYWIGTQERGVFYCPSFDNGLLTGIPGMDQAVVKGVTWDAKSTLYAGYFNGKVYAINLNNWSARDISWPKTNLIHRLSYDIRSHTLVLAGNDNNLYRAGQWIAGHIFFPLLKQYSPWKGRKVIPARQPGRWLSASSLGLFYVNIENRQLEKSTVDYPKKANSHLFYSICEDQSGRIWAADRHGLSEWREKEVKRIGTAYPALQESISDIALLPDNSLVLSPVGHGVVFWKPGRDPLEINSRQGLLSDEVTGLYLGKSNAIWACTNSGVNKLISDGLGGFRIVSYSTGQGLPSNNINAVCETGDTVWFATGKGLFRMVKQLGTIVILPPYITTVLVENKPYIPEYKLSLPHDSSTISLEFVSLFFRSRGKIVYQYRLLESSGDTIWRQSTERQINYPNLSPGKYRFEVRARIENGLWSPARSLQIDIRPPWYATWWARLTGLAIIGLLALGVYRYRVNQILWENKLREEIQELKQAALQAQMNPHFIFNCLNSIQHFIIKNEVDAAVLYLAKFARLVREALKASVAGKISLAEEIHMLDNYLALEKLRFNNTFDYYISTDDRLNLTDTYLPPLIVQPFVENAVIHGMKNKNSGGLIEVRFVMPEKGMLRIEVQDNGTGKPTFEKPGSMGTNITLRRLELLERQKKVGYIKAWYEQPAAALGTIVVVQLPIVDA